WRGLIDGGFPKTAGAFLSEVVLHLKAQDNLEKYGAIEIGHLPEEFKAKHHDLFEQLKEICDDKHGGFTEQMLEACLFDDKNAQRDLIPQIVRDAIKERTLITTRQQ